MKGTSYMHGSLSSNYLYFIGFTLLVLLSGCLGTSDDISPEEAKKMILRFLSNPSSATYGKWVSDSRILVEKDIPSRVSSGEIIVGPWVINPSARHVYLSIDRARLDGSFLIEGGIFTITDIEITEIRP